MVPLEILPPENPERFPVANGTIDANVTIGENIGSPNGTIGKPNGVKINIMINTSNLFSYSYFFMCIVQYFYYLRIYINLKFKTPYWIM